MIAKNAIDRVSSEVKMSLSSFWKQEGLKIKVPINSASQESPSGSSHTAQTSFSCFLIHSGKRGNILCCHQGTNLFRGASTLNDLALLKGPISQCSPFKVRTSTWRFLREVQTSLTTTVLMVAAQESEVRSECEPVKLRSSEFRPKLKFWMQWTSIARFTILEAYWLPHEFIGGVPVYIRKYQLGISLGNQKRNSRRDRQ